MLQCAAETDDFARFNFRSSIAGYKRIAIEDYGVTMTTLTPEAIAEFRKVAGEVAWPIALEIAGPEGPGLWAQVEAECSWIE